MGCNTTVVVYNDTLDAIADDAEFGKKLADAIRAVRPGERQDVSAGHYMNAAMVVESHHADQCAVVTVGGNLGICQVTVYGSHHHTIEGAERALSAWAKRLGLTVTRAEVA